MNRKIIIGVVVLVLLVGWFLMSRQGKAITSPQATVQQSSPTPEPLPAIVIDGSTNLQQTNDSLTPRDFSKDYQQLKDQAKQIQ